MIISIDFWNTIVEAKSNGHLRQKARLDALYTLADHYDKVITPEDVEVAKRKASAAFDDLWLGKQRTMTTSELVALILIELGLEVKEEEQDEIIRVFQESLWEGPPKLAPGLKEVLPILAKNHSLAIISDTMFSPGRVIKQYLDHQEILQYFSIFVFSDETGFSKPDRRAFEMVMKESNASPQDCIHIGDIHRTDIIGAQTSSWKSVLYAGISQDSKSITTADYIIEDWNEILPIVS